MQSIRFDPRITTDLQLDWRRPDSGQTADLFADLLKRRFDAEPRATVQQEIGRREIPHRRDDPAGRVSGRRPDLVIAHAKTLRGEAKEVPGPDDRVLPDNNARREDAQAEAVEQAAAPAETAAITDAAAQGGTSEPSTEGDAAGEAPDQAAAIAPGTPIVVPTQSSNEASEAATADVTALPVEPILGEDGQVLLPEQTDQTADATAEKSPSASDSTAGQAVAGQAVTALAEAGMVDVAAALSAEPASPGAPALMPEIAGMAAPASTPIESDQPNLRIFQVPAAFGAEAAAVAPAPQARLDRSSMDIKLRPGTTPQGRPASSEATPAPQPSTPQQALAQPSTAMGAFGTTDDLLLEPFSADGSGPGWTLHLAQGAAGKRAEFIAQLRQHLQNLPAHEQVAVHIQRAVREGTGRLSVQLSPAELGRIHVKLEIDEDKRVTAAVTVERPSTLELLQRDIRGLERALHNAGLMMEGGDLSFNLARGDQEFAQDLGQSGASAANGLASGAETEAEHPMAPAAQVMDTAAGVVNLQV